MPNELAVPHWATAMVANYRRAQNLPEDITDEMIFARIEECRGMDPADIEDAVGDLREEI